MQSLATVSGCRVTACTAAPSQERRAHTRVVCRQYQIQRRTRRAGPSLRPLASAAPPVTCSVPARPCLSTRCVNRFVSPISLLANLAQHCNSDQAVSCTSQVGFCAEAATCCHGSCSQTRDNYVPPRRLVDASGGPNSEEGGRSRSCWEGGRAPPAVDQQVRFTSQKKKGGCGRQGGYFLWP